MYCAECGHPLQVKENVYQVCCNNKGYWCDIEPERNDDCLGHLARVEGLWLYVTTDESFSLALPRKAA